MKWVCHGLFAVIFGVSYIFFQGCVAPEKDSVKIEKSLPEKQLAYYFDPFDKLREELWEKAAPVYQRHLNNYEAAEMRIENGQFKVITKTDSFSSGGLASKYALRGDFDIQLDCHIDFLPGARNMDQVLYIVATEKGVGYNKSHGVFITANKKGTEETGVISSGRRTMGNIFPGNWYAIDNFHGTLRITREGHRITTFYKSEAKAAWNKMNTFESTTNDLIINFALANFMGLRVSISANSKVRAAFDNFKINGAQGIIEADI